ncbi:hypothetical protein D3C76_684440 [compost metagenome]
MFEDGLVDPAFMSPHVSLQSAIGQVADHLTAQAQVEQGLARVFEAVVTAQELAIGTVGQVQQSHAADLFVNERHPGQGHRALVGGVLAARAQVGRQ